MIRVILDPHSFARFQRNIPLMSLILQSYNHIVSRVMVHAESLERSRKLEAIVKNNSSLLNVFKNSQVRPSLKDKPIAQFQYFKIQPKTIDITNKLREINPTNSIVYSPEPRTRAEVYCLRLNISLSKLGYCFKTLLVKMYAKPLPNFARGKKLWQSDLLAPSASTGSWRTLTIQSARL